MAKQLIFCYLHILRWGDEVVASVRADGIARLSS